METVQKALPEKTFFFTRNPLVVSGNAVAPVTRPAFKTGRKTRSNGSSGIGMGKNNYCGATGFSNRCNNPYILFCIQTIQMMSCLT